MLTGRRPPLLTAAMPLFEAQASIGTLVKQDGILDQL
jgi:hypothetical protein